MPKLKLAGNHRKSARSHALERQYIAASLHAAYHYMAKGYNYAESVMLGRRYINFCMFAHRTAPHRRYTLYVTTSQDVEHIIATLQEHGVDATDWDEADEDDN